MPREANLYVRLGLPLNARPEEIRHAYRESARRLHPDINVEPGDTQLFLEMQEAYEILSDPEKRARYDATLNKDLASSRPISVKTLFSRSKLTRIKEPQLIYVLLTLSPNAPQEMYSNPPTNLCLVLDSSTSMQGACMDTVKATAIELIRQMKPEDLFSLVSFNDRAEVLVSGGSRQDYDKLATTIRMLRTRGGTEIYQGLQAGVAEVSSHRRKGCVNHVILLTDGHTYGDELACLELAKQSASQGIGISAFGIGNKWNDTFLDNLASNTGGTSIYVAHPEQISDLLPEIFIGFSQSFADNISYTFETSPGVDLKYAFRLQPETSPVGKKSPMMLGSIPIDGKCSIILEFLVKELPTNTNHAHLLQGWLTLQLPTQPEGDIRIPVELHREISKKVEFETPPPAIMQAMSRLTLYRMQEQAKSDLDEGNVKEATRRLRYLATHLLSYGDSDLAATVLEEVENITHSRSLSEEGIKRIKYGTRSLVQPIDYSSSMWEDILSDQGEEL